MRDEARSGDADSTGAIKSSGSSLCPYPSKCPSPCITTVSRSMPVTGDRSSVIGNPSPITGHRLVMGLLITPCGLRLPLYRSYYTKEYLKQKRWVDLCLITVLYLEWYRAEKLPRCDLSETQKRWWCWQRMHGLCVAVRQETEEKELDRLADYTKTKGGLRKLKHILRAARPVEQRLAT